MKIKQKQFTFSLPEEVLENLRRESGKTGIPVASLIKTKLKNAVEKPQKNPIYFQDYQKEENHL